MSRHNNHPYRAHNTGFPQNANDRAPPTNQQPQFDSGDTNPDFYEQRGDHGHGPYSQGDPSQHHQYQFEPEEKAHMPYAHDFYEIDTNHTTIQGHYLPYGLSSSTTNHPPPRESKRSVTTYYKGASNFTMDGLSTLHVGGNVYGPLPNTSRPRPQANPIANAYNSGPGSQGYTPSRGNLNRAHYDAYPPNREELRVFSPQQGLPYPAHPRQDYNYRQPQNQGIPRPIQYSPRTHSQMDQNAAPVPHSVTRSSNPVNDYKNKHTGRDSDAIVSSSHLPSDAPRYPSTGTLTVERFSYLSPAPISHETSRSSTTTVSSTGSNDIALQQPSYVPEHPEEIMEDLTIPVPSGKSNKTKRFSKIRIPLLFKSRRGEKKSD